MSQPHEVLVNDPNPTKMPGLEDIRNLRPWQVRALAIERLPEFLRGFA